VWKPPEAIGDASSAAAPVPEQAQAQRAMVRAWAPWCFLSMFVVLWGITPSKSLLNGGPSGLRAYRASAPAVVSPVLSPSFDVPGLHRAVFRDFPVVLEAVQPGMIGDAAYREKHAEPARFVLNWLSATGNSILLAAIATALFLRISPATFLRVGFQTLVSLRWALATIALMMSIGFITRYSGTDATLGLAFTRSGSLYPFFAALLGWLGVALTGSDTSSNVLFGSLQKITAQQLHLNPVLITAANSTGGVMGKMIDAQSIAISTAATGQSGQEGSILRFVFWHSIALACVMGVIVMLQAYVFPWMIPKS
jgi:lactate permease